MESEFESYDNLPNGWVYLFQVGDTAGRVCGAEPTDRLHVVTFPSFYPAKGFQSGLGAGGYPFSSTIVQGAKLCRNAVLSYPLIRVLLAGK